MRLSVAARAGLHAALELALADPVVTVAAVARRHGMSPATLSKAFRSLARAGIAQGNRGGGGGYRLARPARDITVLQVLETFDPPLPVQECSVVHGMCSRSRGCRLRLLFAEVDEIARAALASVSLDTLARPSQVTAT